MYIRLFHAFFALLMFTSVLYFGSKPIAMDRFYLPPIGSFFCPSTGFWQNAESWDAMPEEQIDLPGLMGEVRVYFNERRVPYLYGDHFIDLITVQGYLHAKDRLWQMDINTRAAAGWISEILGAQAIPFDRRQQNYGMLRSARDILARLSEDAEAKRYLEAYSEGVNEYIDELTPPEYPLEFKLLHYEPTRWSPLHTVLFMKNMQKTLANKQEDLEHTNAAALMGRDSFMHLFPDWFPLQRPVISEDREWNFEPLKPDTVHPKSSISLYRGEASSYSRDDNDGSNSWVLSGAKTRSGAPILCNDPHLELSLPSIWYEMQLSTPQQTTYGVSFPGTPFIIIGFNEDIAWGFTNGGHDVMDWYEIDWEDREKGRYRVGNRTLQADPYRDSLIVKGQKPLVFKGWETKFGTVWNEPGHPLDGMAMHWLANRALPGNKFRTFLLMNRAENQSEFRDAIRHFNCPIQNFAFASKTDTIGMYTRGTYPVKPGQYGKFILDGSSEKDIPEQFIPREQMPFEVNPERQYVSSANQHSTDPDYPYYYNGFFGDYRGRYLNELLDRLDSAGIDEMKDLQNNSQSLFAIEGLQILEAYEQEIALTPGQRDTLAKILEWDGTFRASSWEPAYFSLWWDEFTHAVWDEFQQENTPLLPPEDWMLVSLALEEPDHPLFDHQKSKEREDVRDLIGSSFQKTFGFWDSLYTEEGKPVSWALYNNARIDHLAGLPGFSTERMIIDGHRFALNAQNASKGPSWRMIVHMTDTVEAYGVYPGGQSGNPGSPYYDNQIEQWKNGAYYRLRFAPDEGEMHTLGYRKQAFKPEE